MNPYKSLKNLPKGMWVLFFTTLINRSGSMFLTFLVIYLSKYKNIPVEEAAISLFVYGIAALFTSPIIGRISDRTGKIIILELSLFSTGVLMLFYPFIDSFYLILVLTFIVSVVNEAFRPAILALISEMVTPEQRKPAFALNRLAINLGLSVGPVLGGFLMAVNYDLIFYIESVTCIGAFAFLFYSRKYLKQYDIVYSKEKSETNKGNSKSAGISRFKFHDGVLFYFLISIMPVSLVVFQQLGTYSVYVVEKLNHPEYIFGFLALINTTLIIFLEVPVNSWMYKVSDKRQLIIGAFLTAIGFGLTAFSPNLYFIGFTIVIWTFGEMIFFPSSANYVAAISPKERRGEYMGLYQVTFNLSFSLGPFLGTLTLEKYGPYVLWIGTFAASMLSVIMLFKLKSRRNDELTVSN